MATVAMVMDFWGPKKKGGEYVNFVILYPEFFQILCHEVAFVLVSFSAVPQELGVKAM